MNDQDKNQVKKLNAGIKAEALLISHGCRSNRYETEALAMRLRKAGFHAEVGHEAADILPTADLLVLNSCTVTAEAGRKARQFLRKARRENPEAVIAVMGCYSQLSDLSELADICSGTSDRLQFADEIIERFNRRAEETSNSVEKATNSAEEEANRVEELQADGQVEADAYNAKKSAKTAPNDQEAACMGYLLHKPGYSREKRYEEFGSVALQSGTRAEVKIEDGCNKFCTYCAIALARGRVRSRERHDILAEVKALADNGVKEIVLTGIHICSFESEKGRDSIALAEICDEIAEIEGVERIRLGSLEPRSITAEVLRRFSVNEKLAPYFHLSLQSGSNSVLRRMRRDYTAEEYAERVDLIRKYYTCPGIGSDVMVAFPEESAEEFAASLQFVKDMRLSRMHVFRYSIRKGTKAAKMPQVPSDISKERGRIMGETAAELEAQFARDNIGLKHRVILEQQIELAEDLKKYVAENRPQLLNSAKIFTAYAGNYLPCLVFCSEEYTGGEMPEVEIKDAFAEKGLATVI